MKLFPVRNELWYQEIMDHLQDAGKLLHDHGIENVKIMTLFGSFTNCYDDGVDYRALCVAILQKRVLTPEQGRVVNELMRERENSDEVNALRVHSLSG